MKKILILTMSLFFAIPTIHAHYPGRYEILPVSALGGIIVKLDRYSGASFSYTDKKRKPGWKAIRNDEISKDGLGSASEITFQILSTDNRAILYNIQTGGSWKLAFGPTGYQLYWERIEE